MTAKLIVSVKEVNGIAQVVYYCKERRRIYRKSFADTVREFRDAYRKANKKQVATGEGYAAGLRPAAPLPGGRGGCTPTCHAIHESIITFLITNSIETMLCEIISETKGTIINLPIQGDINISRDDYIEINNVRYVVRRKEYILKTEIEPTGRQVYITRIVIYVM